MTYKNIDEKTFGSTPAAMYLVRKLNEAQDPVLLRNAGKRITTTMKQLEELNNSFLDESLSPKTFSNVLRLMRLEISDEPDISFIDKLRKNVQIGAIKKYIRVSTVQRKLERVVANPRLASYSRYTNNIVDLYLYDKTSKINVYAGAKRTDCHADLVAPPSLLNMAVIDSINSKLLHERSDRRCTRLKKPHMLN